jgi:murein DD-endopeptidase MepM/ murein hydrolase activator NlpD
MIGIVIASVKPCLALSTPALDFSYIAPETGNLVRATAHLESTMTRFNEFTTYREPKRRSIRKSYSKRRLNRRWKSRFHVKTIKAKPAVKFDVPANGSSFSGLAETGNIEKYKGHLPWPVSTGTVSMRFGLYEVLKGINHNSIGITIETTPGMPVSAVFGGVVQSVFTVDNKPVVMIRHGKYFTTYSNLAIASVAKDQEVVTGQSLGQVAENGQMDFIISDIKDTQYDPEKWLKK